MKKPKYKAMKTWVYGIQFDSQKEAHRYMVLMSQLKAGRIKNLTRQVKYDLLPAVKLPSGVGLGLKFYKSDFEYDMDGKHVVEDVKGYKKGMAYQMFLYKKHLMWLKYGIEVIEV